MGKNMIFTAKGCLRSVWKHPFLVCTLCFWMFMFRISPVIFSLFVSASPVFVCTAVLLGALLSFGGPNVATTKVEDKEKQFSASVTCGESKACNDGEIARKRSDDLGLVRDGGPVEKQGIVSGKRGVRQVDRKVGYARRKKKNRWSDGSDRDIGVRNDALNRVVREHRESDYEKSEDDSFDSERVNVDSPPCSMWGKLENPGIDGDEEDETLESGSDACETSSPDASTTDMMPMLDELHPLLDEEAAQLVQMSLQGSHATSDMSLMSSTSGNESDVETNEDLDAGDEDDDDTQGGKNKRAQPAIIWTEEDQQSLHDLGSSEIERNQRLESLMMQRRRERRFKSMVSDADLIGIETSNARFSLTPISTARQNPFDVPHDSYGNPGAPPVPASAPSMLAAGCNPFDSPCDSSGYSSKFQPELGLLPPTEMFFRKQENFIIRPPSVNAISRLGKEHVKMTPYFVPDSMIPPASSGYSPFLQPSSEMSSQLSSRPETTSVSSADDLEDQRLVEEQPVDAPENRLSTDQEPDSNQNVFKQVDSIAPKMVSENAIQYSENQPIDSNDRYKGLSTAQTVEVPGSQYQTVYAKVPSSSSFSELRRMAFKEDIDTEDEGFKDDAPDDGSMPSTAASSPTDVVQRKKPVFDSSPPSIRKNLASNSFNLHSESPLDLLPLHIKRTISMIERHYERISRETDNKDNSNNVTKLNESSTTHTEDKHKNSDASKVAQSLESRDASTPSEATNDKNSSHLEGEKHQDTSSEKDSLTRVRVSSSEGKMELLDRINRGKNIIASNNPNNDDDDDDDDDDLFHEAQVKISTPSVGESRTSTIFYNITMNDPNSERLKEAQVPNTPIDPNDKFKAMPNLNIPNIHELIETTLHVESPYTPGVPSMPSSATMETGPHFNMETILEEVKEVKEFEGMSETDNEGESSYWLNRKTAFDKYVESLPESSSSTSVENVDSDHGDKSETRSSTKKGSPEGIEEKVVFVGSEEPGLDNIDRVVVDSMDDDDDGKASDSTTA